ncbi:diguanylate cyclase/phosphodiesterase (GGDEF & EAL domains) with PAS/PAC sensor(s) [hydrothermal vent metagenome]|uniref:histidine kinase n=1 Tax=hydrothermal vent metagenome TaxID=652676 RepID=A0A3B0WYV8_9ZZZZ
MLKHHSIRSPIARRLIIYILLFSSCITFLITAIQLYRDYKVDLNAIHSELQKIEDIHLESITTALWASNKKLLQTNIEGILKIRDMQYVEILDDEQIWASAGKKTAEKTTAGKTTGRNTEKTIQRVYPINYMHRNKSIKIGKLTVVVSLSGVYQRLIKRIWIILFFNALKTFIVAIFIYFLFYNMIAKHLSKISAFAEDHKPLSSSQPLTLDRASQHHDEFDSVVKSINDMHIRLEQQINETSQQKKHLSLTLNSIGDAVIATDAAGNITRMNPVAEKLTGWTFDQAKGKSVKSIFSIIDASTLEPIENPVEKVIASGETVYLSNHTTLISRNGERYQIADSAAPIKDEEDKILGMVLIFNDVTKQYQLRQLARESEKKYHTLTTVAPVGIIHSDKQGKCLYVNEKWCELTGISAEKAMEEGWEKSIYTEDQQQVLEQWNQCISNAQPFKSEYRLQLNTTRWVLGLSTTETDENAKIIGYVGTITDITDRKKAEETIQISKQRLTDAQRMAHIGNWELDLVNNSLTWSDEVYRIFELNHELFSEPYTAFLSAIHPEDLDKVNNAFNESIENKTQYSIDHRICTPDGTIKTVHQRCVTFYNNEGDPVQSVGTVQDITEQVNMENTIRRTQKMDALGKLTGGIAHDYNNMLGVIMGYADILQENLKQQPKLEKFAQQIYQAGERGANLTKKLLSFSRTNNSDGEAIDLNILLNNEQDMLQKILTARINLIYNLSNDLWLTWLNSDDLENAIVNLSINAMHAMEGVGQLTVRTYNIHIDEFDSLLPGIKGGDYVILSVIDTGCGMDDITKEKVYEPFYTTKGEKGTGLGLSQVYGFVNRSGGEITVYSKLGYGTQFTLYFPRHNKKENRKKTEPSRLTTNLSGSETILIVDDEPALLELTHEILIQQGYNAICAENAQAALKILKNKKVDFMLSDIIMPGMDGYQLAAIVENKYPETKIQLTSGFSDEQHIGMVDDSLHKNLLYKPLNSQILLKRIRELLT